MDQNYSSTKLPTVGASSAIGGASAWSNPDRITADDASSATWGAFMGGQHSMITGSTFDFQQLPDSAVIDGIEVYVDGSQTGCYGDITISAAGTTYKDLGALSGAYGGATDLWGAASISLADIASLSVAISASDVAGGDAIASIDYVSITVFWHIEVINVAADVPTRIAYKVYSRAGNYLGELPKVSSKFILPQDINSAGSSITITCGKLVDSNLLVATGASADEVIFKNSNRVQVWVYNQYYPNGKLEFSGQINRVGFKYGGGDASVRLIVYSDGHDLNNFIARGYPFAYTDDVTQSTSDTHVTIIDYGGPWVRCGQTWVVGAGVTNIGTLTLRLIGTATVTVYIFDGPNGNLLGSVTKAVAVGSYTNVTFEFPQLIDVTAGDEYFFAVSVPAGQSMGVKYNTASVYANGVRYESIYGGGGGGSYSTTTGDLYFITASGTPTTTTTYTADDPVTDMAHNILLDYNARGGLITERDFDATALSLTYTFVMAFIYDAIKKILELCPTGYYVYVDVGSAEIDIKSTSVTADFTVVRGKHINELDLALSTEQVKNYLLFTGGDTGAGVNLYQDYTDSASASNYGIRTVPKSDNRVTIAATANAIGDTFIEENANETQETTLTVLSQHIDIALLTPGKTIGFRNFGNFIDDMILQIVRREINFSDGTAILTLGRLPIRMNDYIQRINRDLLNEQTINNPSSPS